MNQDMRVWVPDPVEIFVRGDLLNTDIVKDKFTGVEQQVGLVKKDNDGETATFKISEIFPVNPANFDRVDNMSELTHLNEPSVLNNLENRYKDNLIYTYSGLFLVAINPYKEISNLYSNSTIKSYHSSNEETSQKPHIFEVAESAYRDLKSKKQDQSILVTGESGAGKTENTKKILQYLASITSDSFEVSNNFEMKILQSNPVLESFGNAQTVRNNNSSRFGKFIKIEFDQSGKINGAFIEWYLLEKSRITNENRNERNYHIFYQLLKGTSQKDLESIYKLSSNDFAHYQILANSNHVIPGVDDAAEFQKLLVALETVGFGKDQINSIFKIVAVILHCGNIEFVSEKSEQASFKSDISAIATLLGVSESDFKTAILKPRSKAGREWVSQAKNANQARFIINSLCRTLYEHLFGYIVDTINMSLNHGSMTANYIGLLDIAGFEIFEHNSFEQLCINYTNEKLQQFFNHHMFVLEQSEYLKENIQWDYVDYGKDLQSTINLLEAKGPPTGILPLLDEETILPKSEDSSFYSKLISTWQQNSTKFKRSKLDMCFVLKHYAGDVEYHVNGWLAKNKDPLNENLVNILSVSSNRLISEFFSGFESISSLSSSPTRLTHSSSSASISSLGKGRTNLKTALSRHREQQSSLLSQLALTNPHFVRCIIPNNKKMSETFDRRLILDQLRCNGVLEGIRIAREGYPNRILFKEFYERYRILSEHLDKSSDAINYKQSSQILISELHLDPTTYKVGTSKLFFKAGTLAELESKKESILFEITVRFNSIIRGWSQRKRTKGEIQKMRASEMIGNVFRKYNEKMQDPWFNMYMKIKPLLASSQNIVDSRKYTEKIKVLEQKLTAVETEKKIHTAKHNDLLNELNDVKNLLDVEKEKLKRNEQLLSKSNEQQREIETMIKEIREDKSTLLSEKEAAISKIQELELVRQKLEEKNNEKDASIAELTRKLSSLESEKGDITRQISMDTEVLKKLENEKMEKERVIEKLSHDIKERDHIIDELKQKEHISNKDLDIKLQTLEKNCNVALTKLKSLLNENAELREEVGKSKKLHANTIQQVSSKEKEIERLKARFASNQGEINEILKQRDSLMAENDKLSKELSEMKMALRKANENYAQMKNQMEEMAKQEHINKENSPMESRSDISLLKKQLEDEKSLNKYLNQKLLGDRVVQTSLHLDDLSNADKDVLLKKYYEIKTALHEQSTSLEEAIEENKNLISRLRFTETRLASSSFESQTVKAQLKKLKHFLENKGMQADIDQLFSDIKPSDVNVEQILLEVQHLKMQLNAEQKAHKEAEAAITALHSKFELIQKVDSTSDIYKIKYEASEEHVRALENKLRSLPFKDRTNLPSGEIFTNKDSISKYEEELRFYKIENFKLQDKLSEFENICGSLKHEIKQGSVKEVLLEEQVERLQKDLESTERQKEMLTSNLRQQRQQYEDCLSDLNANETQLREYNHALKQAEDDIKGMATVIEKLKSSNKQKDKTIWDRETEKNDLDMQLQETLLELKRVQDMNQLLQTDVHHFKERLNTSSDVSRYTNEIERLKEALDESSKYSGEFKKEISKLKYKLETLKNDSEAKIEHLLKQSEHYETIVGQLGEERDENQEIIKDLNQKLIDMESNLKKLNDDYEALSQQRDTLLQESDRLRSELGNSTEQFNATVKHNVDVNDKLRNLEETLRLQTEQNERNEQLVKSIQMDLESYKMKYDEEKQKNIDLVEEAETLKSVTVRLEETIKDLDQRLSDTSEKEAWLRKIHEVETLLNDERDMKIEEMKKSKALERTINELEARNASQVEVIETANGDRTKFEETVMKYNDQMHQLEKYISQQEIDMKKVVRENMEYQEKMNEMERELMLWKQRYHVASGGTNNFSQRNEEEVMVQT